MTRGRPSCIRRTGGTKRWISTGHLQARRRLPHWHTLGQYRASCSKRTGNGVADGGADQKVLCSPLLPGSSIHYISTGDRIGGS
eukprot:798341-Rhodomonas_salina.4